MSRATEANPLSVHNCQSRGLSRGLEHNARGVRTSLWRFKVELTGGARGVPGGPRPRAVKPGGKTCAHYKLEHGDAWACPRSECTERRGRTSEGTVGCGGAHGCPNMDATPTDPARARPDVLLRLPPCEDAGYAWATRRPRGVRVHGRALGRISARRGGGMVTEEAHHGM